MRMLRSLKDLERYTVSAVDGNIGNVVDFFLDDERWIVRYLIVETGSLFERREVLISPISFRQVDWSTLQFHLALTKDRVQNSPSVEVDKPVSRQYEWDYSRYYEYPHYWGYSGLWGVGAYPSLLAAARWRNEPLEHSCNPSDVHLRSAGEIRGYHIQGSDDEIGHVEDFIVDDETWEVRYLVIDTNNWWFGKKMLVAPHWASRISWAEGNVYVDLSRQAIKNSPEWDACAAVNHEYEVRLYDYFGRPAYWKGGDGRKEARPEHHSLAHPE
jgi:hypothetical protein